MFEILFAIIVAAYFIQVSLLSIGSKKRFQKIDHNELPTSTVIVAARNEELNILDCLNSLNDLVYPDEKLEIIIVDDDSTDATNKIINNFIADKPKFKLIKPLKEYGQTKAKARAIANAIEIAKGEIILTTDADCIVNPMWAKTMASYFKKNVLMVCGYTNQYERSLFHAVQDMDFIYLLTVAGGAINLGKPLSAIGNNMSYRKSAYNKTGGYAQIPFSVTEDFQLLMAINKIPDGKIIYPSDKDCLVTSKPCPDIKTLLYQKRRWAVGGLKSTFDNLLIISTGFWVAVFIILLPFFYSASTLYLLLLKIFADFFMVYFVYERLELKFGFGKFLLYEIYQILYFVITGVSLLFTRKVIWKGRKF